MSFFIKEALRNNHLFDECKAIYIRMVLEAGPGNESVFYLSKNLKCGSVMKEIFTAFNSAL